MKKIVWMLIVGVFLVLSVVVSYDAKIILNDKQDTIIGDISDKIIMGSVSEDVPVFHWNSIYDCAISKYNQEYGDTSSYLKITKEDGTLIFPKKLVSLNKANEEKKYVILDAPETRVSYGGLDITVNYDAKNDILKLDDYTVRTSTTLPDGIEVVKYTSYTDNLAGKYIEKHHNNQGTFSTKNLFVSYAGLINESIEVNGQWYHLSYVECFSPILIAIETYLLKYLAIIAVAVVYVVIVAQIFRKQVNKAFKATAYRNKLTRDVAHELKTPLAVIKTSVENWQYIEDEDKDEYSKRMIGEIDHANKMVVDLLELSRYETGNKTLQTEAVDFNMLTKTVLNQLMPIVKDRSLDVVVNSDMEEMLAIADLEMIRTVISNFITNAIKHAEKEIVIKIARDKKKLFYSVTNDGDTIPKENLEIVWDLFYKNDDSRTDRLKSNGVGLSISKNILELHKAKYGCISDDRTTSFWFEI